MASTDNAKYVRRGGDLVTIHDRGWQDELMERNTGKEGAPFKYTDSLIMLASSLRTAFGIPYRQLSGIMGRMLQGRDSPDYSVLCRWHGQP